MVKHTGRADKESVAMVELLMQNYGITYEYAVYLMNMPIMDAIAILNTISEAKNGTIDDI